MTKTENALQALEQEIALLKQRVENLRGETSGIADMTIQIALLQQRVDDMREGWKTWAQRLWMALAPIAGVAIGYYLNSRK